MSSSTPSTRSLFLLSATLLAQHVTSQATPIMGFNSYNQVACSPNSSTITAAINAMSSRGFVDAGYKYFQVDCGWANRDGERNASTGSLAIDYDRFPDGLSGLADLAREKGMEWSMYSDAGVRMCDTEVPSPVLGSLGYEDADAALFASLGTTYVKYDNCYVDGSTSDDNAPKTPRDDFVTRYGVMWDALKNVSIDLMLICQWGVPYSASSGLEGPNQWAPQVSTSFRLADDIATGWDNVYRIYNQAIHIAESGLSGPGHFADADLLEVGQSGMTTTEQATHFAAWAMIKSALMVSTDLDVLSDDLVAVLQNEDLIAINQDSLGEPITLVQRFTDDYDVWSGKLADGDIAVLVVDLSDTARTLSLDLSLLGLDSATILDLWTGDSTSSATSYSSSVSAHGSLALRLSSTTASSSYAPSLTTYAASNGTLSNGAVIDSCSGCATSNKVGNIGGSSNGTLTLTGVTTSEATQSVRFAYVNGDVGFLGGTNNERLAQVSVNGGEAVTVSFPLSGYNWDADVKEGYLVELSGFDTSGENTIAVFGYGDGSWGPDLSSVGVIA